MSILHAYAYLAATYEPGDELFVYGFSRGAYTARSLVGLLAQESSASITLKQAEGKEATLLRADLDSLKAAGRSLMPEGLEKLISQASGHALAIISAIFSIGPILRKA